MGSDHSIDQDAAADVLSTSNKVDSVNEVGKPQLYLRKQGQDWPAVSRALALVQDENCASPSEPIKEFILDKSTDDVEKWLTETTGGKIVLGIFDLFVDETLIQVKGVDIKGEDGGVCQRLPLNDTQCYTTINPEISILEALVKRYVPFGKELLEAIDTAEEFINNITEPITDIADSVEEAKDAVKSFFLPEDDSETGEL